MLLGLSCLHITRLQRLHPCKWHFPRSAALQLLLGVLGRGRRGSTVSWGEEWDRAGDCASELRTARGVSWGCLWHRARPLPLSLSPGVVCVKEHELKADLLCHPDFGFCHREFLFRFWKLLFSPLLGSPRGIGTHRRAHPQRPPSHRSCGGSGEVGLGIFDQKWGKSVTSMSCLVSF